MLNHLCYCDQSSDIKLNIRTVSLMEQLTDSLDNRVVTGIRFAVKYNMITIEIQEGQLVNGIVNRTSVKWKKDLGYLPENGPESVKLNYNFKSFNLDDIELPFGQFVTGVKFILVANNHLSLRVRGTQMYNHSTNYPSVDHDWHYPHLKYDEERIIINIKDLANSAEVINQTTELSRSGRDYINLSVGLYSDEFNNLAVIPFFDSQNVVTEPPAPFGGVGFFYKGQPGFGGFLSFKLMKVKNNFY
ncbi:uncharacterized protein LOC130673336 [Microplitis mediator]|uniref:uncharacterized protein LOC130673336 n=1 Tax=Microplitis mediator TaxID=375433 RepID=UPI002553A550|nr:uncharacterized protein LOC130673336 [Microplitis mediator]